MKNRPYAAERNGSVPHHGVHHSFCHAPAEFRRMVPASNRGLAAGSNGLARTIGRGRDAVPEFDNEKITRAGSYRIQVNFIFPCLFISFVGHDYFFWMYNNSTVCRWTLMFARTFSTINNAQTPGPYLEGQGLFRLYLLGYWLMEFEIMCHKCSALLAIALCAKSRLIPESKSHNKRQKVKICIKFPVFVDAS